MNKLVTMKEAINCATCHRWYIDRIWIGAGATGFHFDRTSGKAMLQSHHPGTSIGQVQKQTGWELRLAPDCAETIAPSAAELRLIRACDPEDKWTR